MTLQSRNPTDRDDFGNSSDLPVTSFFSKNLPKETRFVDVPWLLLLCWITVAGSGINKTIMPSSRWSLNKRMRNVSNTSTSQSGLLMFAY